MPHYEIGKIVAERELQLRLEGGTASSVWVRIGLPYESGEDWQCPYEIEIQGKKRTFAIYGIDSIQALTLAMKVIDIELESDARRAAGSLLWHGEPFISILDAIDWKRAK